MISNTKSWKFVIGFICSLLLVSATLAPPLLPMFQWFLISSRDVMVVWFMIIGFLLSGLMAWKLSPAYTWIIFSYVLSSMAYGFKGDTLPNTTALFLGILFLVFLYHAWKDHASAIMFGLFLGVILNILVAGMQLFVNDLGVPTPAGLVFRDPFFAVAASVREIEGLATHYSLLVGFLVVAVPLLIVRYKYAWMLLIPTIYLIWYSHHRTTALCLLFFLWLIPKIKYRKQIVIGCLFASLIFAGSVLYLRGSFTSGYSDGKFSVRAWTNDRDMVWLVTLAKGLQKPILGWGPGTFNIWRPSFVNTDTKRGLTYLQAHNEYLQVFFETGFVGFFSFILFGVWLFYRLWKARPWSYELRGAVCSLACLALISFVSFPFRIGMTAFGGILTLVALHGALNANHHGTSQEINAQATGDGGGNPHP